MKLPAFMISMPGSERTEPERAHLNNALAVAGLLLEESSVTVIPGVRANPSEILWSEMRNLEAYNRFDYLRGDYVPRAVGNRMAAVNAIKAGISAASALPGFLVFEDDAEVLHPEAMGRLVHAAVVGGFDGAWLDCADVRACAPMNWTDKAVHVLGARLCTGMYLSTAYAIDMVERLAASGAEWDLFMEWDMPNKTIIAAATLEGRPASVVRQRPGVSEITGEAKWGA